MFTIETNGVSCNLLTHSTSGHVRWHTLVIPAGSEVRHIYLAFDSPFTGDPGWAPGQTEWREPKYHEKPCWVNQQCAVMFEHFRNTINFHVKGTTVDLIYRDEPITLATDLEIDFGICKIPVPSDVALPNVYDLRFANWLDERGNLDTTRWDVFAGWGNRDDPYWKIGTCLPPLNDPNFPTDRWNRHRQTTSSLLAFYAIGALPRLDESWNRTQNGKDVTTELGVTVCPSSFAYRQFVLNDMDRIFRTFGDEIGGAYLDTSAVQSCDRVEHEHGVKDENGKWIRDDFGNAHKYYCPLKAYEILYRDIWSLCKHHRKMVVMHCHNKAVPGINTWCHALVSGEESRPWLSADPGWYQRSAGSYWEMMQRLGRPVIYIPQFERAKKHGAHNPLLDNVDVQRNALRRIGGAGFNLWGSNVDDSLLQEWSDAVRMAKRFNLL